MDEEPSVKITLADIYAEVVKTGRDVTELNGKLDGVVTKADDQGEELKDHARRLRDLELTTITKKGAYALMGAIGIVATIAGFLVDLFGKIGIH